MFKWLVLSILLFTACQKHSIQGTSSFKEKVDNKKVAQLPGYPGADVLNYNSSTYLDGTTEYGVASDKATIFASEDGKTSLSCDVSGKTFKILGETTINGKNHYHVMLNEPCDPVDASGKPVPETKLSEGYIDASTAQKLEISQEPDPSSAPGIGGGGSTLPGACNGLDVGFKMTNGAPAVAAKPMVPVMCKYNNLTAAQKKNCEDIAAMAAIKNMPGAKWRSVASDIVFNVKGVGTEVTISITPGKFTNGKQGACTGTPKPITTLSNVAQANQNCMTYPDKKISLTGRAADANGFIGIPASEVFSANDTVGRELKIGANFGDAAAACTTTISLTSPVVLDFTGEQDLQTVSVKESKVRFDLQANGSKTRTGWISGERAFLAIDRNGNKKIEDGSELFGNATNGQVFANGYEALISEAKSKIISAKDPIYKQLVLWFDRNQNGISETSEIKTLKEMNVTKISLDYVATNKKPGIFENDIRYSAKFWGPKQCGKAGCASYDVFFSTINTEISSRK